MKKLYTVFIIFQSICLAQNAAAVDINNIYLPFGNKGILADVNYGEYGPMGKYPGPTGEDFLFSAGFYISGYADTTMWANGVASSTLVEDYQPGPIESDPQASQNQIYSILETDPPFEQSWQDWVNAVEQGAYFYDGDGNGIYNPVDKNNNGKWDPDEEKPDILYDVNYFTVFNDGVPKDDRRWDNIDPLGIEIRQSIFASNRNSILRDVVFIRYSLEYKGLGTTSDVDSLTDVIFSVWNDVDIGGTVGEGGAYAYTDDLGGCDTTLNAGYTYNEGEDEAYGINPPAIFKVILQGPRVRTNDINSIAYNKLGPELGLETYQGYKNLGMTTFAPPNRYSLEIDDPNNPWELRNFQNALWPLEGVDVDPCNFIYGEVLGGLNCGDINNKFWFSGDPVTQYGWIQKYSGDMRDLTNTGPFVLRKNERMDIIVAYVVGQGTDALNSITKAREITKYVHEEYVRNFSTVVGVDDRKENVVNSFSLSQNYPNPFNPTSKIKYQIAKLGKVELKVYDIIGREVTTLVNEVKSPGSYEVTFNASQLASGVYFYRLTSGSFIQTKKMILLR